MLYYIIIVILLISILIHFFIEFIHLPKKKFKKYLRFFSLILLLTLVVYLMRFFPAVISSIPAIFIILFKWRNLISFISSILLKKENYKKTNKSSMSKKEAYDILGLKEGASRDEIINSYQILIKKNHPDVGGSDWITKRLNQARDILLG